VHGLFSFCRRESMMVTASAGFAQADPPPRTSLLARDATGRATIRAIRLDSPLVLDGRLDDRVYGLVPPSGGFLQQEPREGAPATEATDVWVFFDDNNVFISARCWDSHMERIVANELRRDNLGIQNNDNFTVLLDTFL